MAQFRVPMSRRLSRRYPTLAASMLDVRRRLPYPPHSQLPRAPHHPSGQLLPRAPHPPNA
jgi:hypothetical protein